MMRALKLAPFFVLVGSLAFACNSDDGEEGGGGSGGSSSGTGGDGGGDGSGGSEASGPFGACAEDEFGTGVAEGTCGTLDDFEGTYDIASDGRDGANWDGPWSDKYGTPEGPKAVADPDDAGNTMYNFSGSGYGGPADDANGSLWGANYALALGYGCYDASVYSGVSLKVKPKSDTSSMWIQMVTADSNPDLDCEGECSNHYRYEAKKLIADEWNTVTFTWAELEHPGWGEPHDFDPSRLQQLAIAADGVKVEEGDQATFEFAIDDVMFTGGSDTGCAEGGMGGAGGK